MTKPHDDATAARALGLSDGVLDALAFEGPRVSVAEAQAQLPALVASAEAGTPVQLTRGGEPVAVLLSVEDYQRLVGEGPSFWDALLAYRSAAHLDDPQDPLHTLLAIDAPPRRDPTPT